jgi:multidrug resistance efflux pump
LLPVFVWLAVVGCVVVLFRHRAGRFEVVGLAQAELYQVAATCTGRLREVPVQLFEKVEAGQTLAVVETVLDNEHVGAELEVARAEIHHLQAQLTAMRGQLQAEAENLETDRIAATRRYAVDVETARLRILEFKTQLETDRMMLRDLAIDVETARELVDKDAIAPYELQKAQAQYDALARQVQENENLLRQATEDFLLAEQRRSDFVKRQPEHPPLDSALEVIRQATNVQQKRVEALLARHIPVELKCPYDGVVSQIWRRSGEALQAGEAVVTVAQAVPTEVVAYAGQNQIGQVRENLPVKLVKSNRPEQVAASQVVHVGPVIELMPERLWQNRNLPQYGLPVLIKIPPGMKLVPGEMVGVRGL